MRKSKIEFKCAAPDCHRLVVVEFLFQSDVVESSYKAWKLPKGFREAGVKIDGKEERAIVCDNHTIELQPTFVSIPSAAVKED